MITHDIPGFGPLDLGHLVLDLNGTLTQDGVLIDGVAPRLKALAKQLSIHLVSADSRGNAADLAETLPLDLIPIPADDQQAAKRDIVRRLGKDACAAVGNGHVDAMMLAEARLGLAVILAEGASPITVGAADAVFTDIRHALDFLLHPSRLTATLRS